MVPTLSHLQFKVLGLLLAGEPTPGRVVREALREAGARQTGPAFYQMMARLEDGGLVEGSYRRDVAHGQPIKERVYVLTPAGLVAWRETRDFYLDVLRGVGSEEGLAGA